MIYVYFYSSFIGDKHYFVVTIIQFKDYLQRNDKKKKPVCVLIRHSLLVVQRESVQRKANITNVYISDFYPIK